MFSLTESKPVDADEGGQDRQDGGGTFPPGVECFPVLGDILAPQQNRDRHPER
jgi:hypothetical protein